jgi:hypothetical protein
MLVDRAETIEALSTEVDRPIIHSDEFRLIIVSNNFAILHYRTFDPDGSNASLRSSCWEMSGNGQWYSIRELLSQGVSRSKLHRPLLAQGGLPSCSEVVPSVQYFL